jgi:hypothetical protein
MSSMLTGCSGFFFGKVSAMSLKVADLVGVLEVCFMQKPFLVSRLG